MKTFKFRTVEWHMNADDPKRILIVKAIKLNSSDISNIIFNAGFRSELVVPFLKKSIIKLFVRDCCK